MLNDILHWGWRGMGSLTLLFGAGALATQWQTGEDPTRLWIAFAVLLGGTVALWTWWTVTKPREPQGDGGGGSVSLDGSRVTASAVAQARGKGSKAKSKNVTKNYLVAKQPKAPPGVRLSVTPSRPPNSAHITLHNLGAITEVHGSGTRCEYRALTVRRGGV